MATFDSTVRLRQLNKPELSGYIVEVIGDIPNTGDLTGKFYPLNSNPSGYVTTGQTGNFITQISLDSNYTNTLVYVGSNYYPLNSNPSGYVSFLKSPLVYSTGNQNISGIKNFYSRPLISGLPILSSGEIYGGFVALTGDQTISGEKSFDSKVYFNDAFLGANQNFIVDKEYIELFDPVSKINVLDWEQGSRFILKSSDGFAKINLYGKIIQDFNNISSENISGINIYKSGYSVISENQLTGVSGIRIEKSGNYLLIGANSSNQNLQNVVYTYGNQNIGGNKKFLDEVIIADTLDAQNLFIVKDQGVFIKDISDDFYPLYFDNGIEFNLNGKEDTSIKFYDKLITGFNNIFSNNIYQDGQKVATLADLSSVVGINIQDVVYKTGTQTINGEKTFSNLLLAPSVYLGGPSLFLELSQNSFGSFNLSNESFYGIYFTNNDFIINGPTGFIDLQNGIITGFNNISGKNIYQNGQKVATLQDLQNIPNSNIQNVVYTTGNQNISGEKRFINKSKFGTGSFRGFFDIEAEAKYGPKQVQDFVAKLVPDNDLGGYKRYFYDSFYNFDIFGYKIFNGKTGFSPAKSSFQFDDLEFDQDQKYYIDLSWIGSSNEYDGYILRVVKDSQYEEIQENPYDYSYNIPKTYGQIFIGKEGSDTDATVGFITDDFNSPLGYYDRDQPYLNNLNDKIVKKSNLYINTGEVDYNLINEIIIDSESISISGQTSFNKRPKINGTGVLLQGEASASTGVNSLNVSSKIFTGNINLNGLGGVLVTTGTNNTIFISGNAGGIINKGENLPGGSGIYYNVVGDALNFKSLKPGSGIRITGDNNNLTFDVTGSFTVPILENAVYTTGNQSISGDKNFLNKIKFEKSFIVPNVEYAPGSEALQVIQDGTALRKYNNQSVQIYEFYVYGYKNLDEKKLYSPNPLTFNIDLDEISISLPYYLKISWTENSFFDGYYFLVGEDPDFTLPIEDGFNSPQYGIFLDKDITSISIGQFSSIDYVSEIGSGYSYVANNETDGFPSPSIKEIEKNIFLSTGYDAFYGSLCISGSTFFNSKPNVNGSGIVLKGEDLDAQYLRTDFVVNNIYQKGTSSNFIGGGAGYNPNNATNNYVNFIGEYVGNDTFGINDYSNLIGHSAGMGAANFAYSIFIGYQAGKESVNYSNSIFIGRDVGVENVVNKDDYPNAFSISIGNYSSPENNLNTIAIGQGAANSSERQLNLANVIYATNINTGVVPSSTPVSNGKVGILIDKPEYTLDVSGTCRITGETVFGVRPTVNGSGVLLQNEAGSPSSEINIYQIRFFT